MKNLSEEIKALRSVKQTLDRLMSDPRTKVEIRSGELYEYIIRDQYLRQLFPDQKAFNRFLRRQHDNGTMKQLLPNYRVDTSNPRFYQWFFYRMTERNTDRGKEVITIGTRLKYNNYQLNKISSNEIRFRSDQEIEIYERLLKCDYLTIECEARLNVKGEIKYPDFKITNRRNQKVYLWEHFGMTGSPIYMDDMAEKIRWYKINGFTTVEEGGHLIYTLFSDINSFHKDIEKYIDLIRQ